MRELDTVLLNYLDNYYEKGDANQKKAFELILDIPDPDLWLLLTGKKTNNDKDVMGVVTRLQNTNNT